MKKSELQKKLKEFFDTELDDMEYSNYFDAGDDWDEEDDHEVSMAKSDLASISELAAEINEMIGDDEELEGWVQAKITLAADYIEAVHRYLKYEE